LRFSADIRERARSEKRFSDGKSEEKKRKRHTHPVDTRPVCRCIATSQSFPCTSAVSSCLLLTALLLSPPRKVL
jgi:hypothetical protein